MKRGGRIKGMGYNMGRQIWPPRPPLIILTDRDDGTLWHLTQNNKDGLDDGYYVAINTVQPTIQATKTITYPADAGPFVNARQGLRLLVRGGYLGYEQVAPEERTDIDTHLVYTHTGLAVARCQLLPLGWASRPDTIGYSAP